MKPEQLFDLSGKVAIVTGGNGGLGLAMALGLAGAGSSIVVAARNMDKTARALSQIEELGAKAMGLKVDVTQESDIEEMVSRTVEDFGQVDILVNNAGMTARKEPQDLGPEEWDQVLDVNLRAAFLAARAVYPHMKDQGAGKDNQHRVHVLHFWRRWQWRALFRQQRRYCATVQEPGRGLGQRQHPVQRHPTRLVLDRIDLSRSTDAAGTIRTYQPSHPSRTVGRA